MILLQRRIGENNAGRNVASVGTPFKLALGGEAVDLARGEFVTGVGHKYLVSLRVDSDAVGILELIFLLKGAD